MKICKVETCTSPVFSHLFCKWHQYLREDLKNKPRPYHKKSEKDLGFGFDNQMEMFLTLWENAKDENCRVWCKYTGEQLNYFHGKNNFWNCFAHVLPKKNYTYFRLNPDNIQIVHPNFHRIIDQGMSKERLLHPEWKWSLWDEKVAQMKQKYIEFKKQNLLS